jgi:hypothetical protein
MANEYTERFQWPIPPWNADWQKWQANFKSFAQNVDATTFALLEHQTLIHHTLPTVSISVGAVFSQLSAAIFVSRTMQTQISVGPNDLDLVPGALIGFSLQPGAVGPQQADWESYVSQTDIDPTTIIVGIVRADGSINWFNGANLPVGTAMTLFDFIGTGGGGTGFLAGHGNPNITPVVAAEGTTYHDVDTDALYLNVDGISRWLVI